MQILIGADLVSTASNFELFKAGDAVSLVGEELVEILNKADFRIFNLEVPLCDEETPIKKCGPALIAPTYTIAGYKAIGANMLTLANNHILDQGESGLRSTIKTLDEAKITYVGAGDIDSAKRASFFEIDGKKIGVYACAEHEFSIVSQNTLGANPYDPLESYDHIAALKANCDYAVVLYHGGKEQYRYPSPQLQRICRKFVDKGADLVICQHSHCIGCEEIYHGNTIVYGQGNFLFDYLDNDFWQTGLLVEIADDFKINYIPVCKDGSSVRLATKEEKNRIMAAFKQRSIEICDDGFVQKEYAKFAELMSESYLVAFSGIETNSFSIRVLNKLSGGRYLKYILSKIYDSDKKLTIRNFVECEAHRELIVEGMKNSISDNNGL